MKKTLIIYSTTDGQTKRICDRIIDFSNRKSEITLCEIENAPEIDLSQYSKMLFVESLFWVVYMSFVLNFVLIAKNVWIK